MPDFLGSGSILGYCTNVHPGATLAQLRHSLERYTLAIKARISPQEPMGVGIWLSAESARQLTQPDERCRFADWLGEHGLQVFTINGFPFSDFHESVVKHRVYQPDWSDPRRLAYTLNLARTLAALIPPGAQGGVSTLPVGWRFDMLRQPGAVEAAAGHLRDLVHHLARLELDTGKLIHVDLEPEPGCYLDTSSQVARFFREHLLGSRDDVSTRAYLRVCHDVCHSAVMFEAQEEALANYRASGVLIGKVQISSAIDANLGDKASEQRRAVLAQLGLFIEARYLHQTVLRKPDGATIFFDDLPGALSTAADSEPAARLRTHFHLPIFLDHVGPLGTTASEIVRCLSALRPADQVQHFEVETYAWNVLPPELQAQDLAEGIARELTWLRDCRGAASVPSPPGRGLG
jgi:hypothetical protein